MAGEGAIHGICGHLKRNNFKAMNTVPSRIISAYTGQCFEVILVLNIIVLF